MQFDRDLNSEYGELFLEVKEYIKDEIRRYTDEVYEKYSENITSLFAKEFTSGFCYVRVKDDYIHIGWFNGSKIVDKHNQFFGNRKMIRGQKVKSLNNISKEAISYYVEQSYFALVEKKELQKLKA